MTENIVTDIGQSYLGKLLEPQVWVPVVTAIVGYLLHSWICMIFRRKDESRRAAIYLSEIKEEVSNGVALFEFMYLHGGEPKSWGKRSMMMTTEAWKDGKFSAILPDDVFQRIVNVAYRTGHDSVMNLRSHLKNYYVCICGQYRRIANHEVDFNPGLYRNSLDGVRMVKKLVAECEEMMKENANRNFWPW